MAGCTYKFEIVDLDEKQKGILIDNILLFEVVDVDGKKEFLLKDKDLEKILNIKSDDIENLDEDLQDKIYHIKSILLSIKNNSELYEFLYNIIQDPTILTRHFEDQSIITDIKNAIDAIAYLDENRVNVTEYKYLKSLYDGLVVNLYKSAKTTNINDINLLLKLLKNKIRAIENNMSEGYSDIPIIELTINDRVEIEKLLHSHAYDSEKEYFINFNAVVDKIKNIFIKKENVRPIEYLKYGYSFNLPYKYDVTYDVNALKAEQKRKLELTNQLSEYLEKYNTIIYYERKISKIILDLIGGNEVFGDESFRLEYNRLNDIFNNILDKGYISIEEKELLLYSLDVIQKKTDSTEINDSIQSLFSNLRNKYNSDLIYLNNLLDYLKNNDINKLKNIANDEFYSERFKESVFYLRQTLFGRTFNFNYTERALLLKLLHDSNRMPEIDTDFLNQSYLFAALAEHLPKIIETIKILSNIYSTEELSAKLLEKYKDINRVNNFIYFYKLVLDDLGQLNNLLDREYISLSLVLEFGQAIINNESSIYDIIDFALSDVEVGLQIHENLTDQFKKQFNAFISVIEKSDIDDKDKQYYSEKINTVFNNIENYFSNGERLKKTFHGYNDYTFILSQYEDLISTLEEAVSKLTPHIYSKSRNFLGYFRDSLYDKSIFTRKDNGAGYYKDMYDMLYTNIGTYITALDRIVSNLSAEQEQELYNDLSESEQIRELTREPKYAPDTISAYNILGKNNAKQIVNLLPEEVIEYLNEKISDKNLITEEKVLDAIYDIIKRNDLLVIDENNPLPELKQFAKDIYALYISAHTVNDQFVAETLDKIKTEYKFQSGIRLYFDNNNNIIAMLGTNTKYQQLSLLADKSDNNIIIVLKNNERINFKDLNNTIGDRLFKHTETLINQLQSLQTSIDILDVFDNLKNVVFDIVESYGLDSEDYRIANREFINSIVTKALSLIFKNNNNIIFNNNGTIITSNDIIDHFNSNVVKEIENDILNRIKKKDSVENIVEAYKNHKAKIGNTLANDFNVQDNVQLFKIFAINQSELERIIKDLDNKILLYIADYESKQGQDEEDEEDITNNLIEKYKELLSRDRDNILAYFKNEIRTNNDFKDNALKIKSLDYLLKNNYYPTDTFLGTEEFINDISNDKVKSFVQINILDLLRESYDYVINEINDEESNLDVQSDITLRRYIKMFIILIGDNIYSSIGTFNDINAITEISIGEWITKDAPVFKLLLAYLDDLNIKNLSEDEALDIFKEEIHRNKYIFDFHSGRYDNLLRKANFVFKSDILSEVIKRDEDLKEKYLDYTTIRIILNTVDYVDAVASSSYENVGANQRVTDKSHILGARKYLGFTEDDLKSIALYALNVGLGILSNNGDALLEHPYNKTKYFLDNNVLQIFARYLPKETIDYYKKYNERNDGGGDKALTHNLHKLVTLITYIYLTHKGKYSDKTFVELLKEQIDKIYNKYSDYKNISLYKLMEQSDIGYTTNPYFGTHSKYGHKRTENIKKLSKLLVPSESVAKNLAKYFERKNTNFDTELRKFTYNLFKSIDTEQLRKLLSVGKNNIPLPSDVLSQIITYHKEIKDSKSLDFNNERLINLLDKFIFTYLGYYTTPQDKTVYYLHILVETTFLNTRAEKLLKEKGSPTSYQDTSLYLDMFLYYLYSSLKSDSPEIQFNFDNNFSISKRAHISNFKQVEHLLTVQGDKNKQFIVDGYEYPDIKKLRDNTNELYNNLVDATIRDQFEGGVNTNKINHVQRDNLRKLNKQLDGKLHMEFMPLRFKGFQNREFRLYRDHEEEKENTFLDLLSKSIVYNNFYNTVFIKDGKTYRVTGEPVLFRGKTVDKDLMEGVDEVEGTIKVRYTDGNETLVVEYKTLQLSYNGKQNTNRSDVGVRRVTGEYNVYLETVDDKNNKVFTKIEGNVGEPILFLPAIYYKNHKGEKTLYNIESDSEFFKGKGTSISYRISQVGIERIQDIKFKIKLRGTKLNIDNFGALKPAFSEDTIDLNEDISRQYQYVKKTSKGKEVIYDEDIFSNVQPILLEQEFSKTKSELNNEIIDNLKQYEREFNNYFTIKNGKFIIREGVTQIDKGIKIKIHTYIDTLLKASIGYNINQHLKDKENINKQVFFIETFAHLLSSTISYYLSIDNYNIDIEKIVEDLINDISKAIDIYLSKVKGGDLKGYTLLDYLKDIRDIINGKPYLDNFFKSETLLSLFLSSISLKDIEIFDKDKYNKIKYDPYIYIKSDVFRNLASKYFSNSFIYSVFSNIDSYKTNLNDYLEIYNNGNTRIGHYIFQGIHGIRHVVLLDVGVDKLKSQYTFCNDITKLNANPNSENNNVGHKYYTNRSIYEGLQNFLATRNHILDNKVVNEFLSNYRKNTRLKLKIGNKELNPYDIEDAKLYEAYYGDEHARLAIPITNGKVSYYIPVKSKTFKTLFKRLDENENINITSYLNPDILQKLSKLFTIYKYNDKQKESTYSNLKSVYRTFLDIKKEIKNILESNSKGENKIDNASKLIEALKESQLFEYKEGKIGVYFNKKLAKENLKYTSISLDNINNILEAIFDTVSIFYRGDDIVLSELLHIRRQQLYHNINDNIQKIGYNLTDDASKNINNLLSLEYSISEMNKDIEYKESKKLTEILINENELHNEQVEIIEEQPKIDKGKNDNKAVNIIQEEPKQEEPIVNEEPEQEEPIVNEEPIELINTTENASDNIEITEDDPFSQLSMDLMENAESSVNPIDLQFAYRTPKQKKNKVRIISKQTSIEKVRNYISYNKLNNFVENANKINQLGLSTKYNILDIYLSFLDDVNSNKPNKYGDNIIYLLEQRLENEQKEKLKSLNLNSYQKAVYILFYSIINAKKTFEKYNLKVNYSLIYNLFIDKGLKDKVYLGDKNIYSLIQTYYNSVNKNNPIHENNKYELMTEFIINQSLKNVFTNIMSSEDTNNVSYLDDEETNEIDNISDDNIVNQVERGFKTFKVHEQLSKSVKNFLSKFPVINLSTRNIIGLLNDIYDEKGNLKLSLKDAYNIIDNSLHGKIKDDKQIKYCNASGLFLTKCIGSKDATRISRNVYDVVNNILNTYIGIQENKEDLIVNVDEDDRQLRNSIALAVIYMDILSRLSTDKNNIIKLGIDNNLINDAKSGLESIISSDHAKYILFSENQKIFDLKIIKLEGDIESQLREYGLLDLQNNIPNDYYVSLDNEGNNRVRSLEEIIQINPKEIYVFDAIKDGRKDGSIIPHNMLNANVNEVIAKSIEQKSNTSVINQFNLFTNEDTYIKESILYNLETSDDQVDNLKFEDKLYHNFRLTRNKNSKINNVFVFASSRPTNYGIFLRTGTFIFQKFIKDHNIDFNKVETSFSVLVEIYNVIKLAKDLQKLIGDKDADKVREIYTSLLMKKYHYKYDSNNNNFDFKDTIFQKLYLNEHLNSYISLTDFFTIDTKGYITFTELGEDIYNFFNEDIYDVDDNIDKYNNAINKIKDIIDISDLYNKVFFIKEFIINRKIDLSRYIYKNREGGKFILDDILKNVLENNKDIADLISKVDLLNFNFDRSKENLVDAILNEIKEKSNFNNLFDLVNYFGLVVHSNNTLILMNGGMSTNKVSEYAKRVSINYTGGYSFFFGDNDSLNDILPSIGRNISKDKNKVLIKKIDDTYIKDTNVTDGATYALIDEILAIQHKGKSLPINIVSAVKEVSYNRDLLIFYNLFERLTDELNANEKVIFTEKFYNALDLILDKEYNTNQTHFNSLINNSDLKEDYNIYKKIKENYLNHIKKFINDNYEIDNNVSIILKSNASDLAKELHNVDKYRVIFKDVLSNRDTNLKNELNRITDIIIASYIYFKNNPIGFKPAFFGTMDLSELAREKGISGLNYGNDVKVQIKMSIFTVIPSYFMKINRQGKQEIINSKSDSKTYDLIKALRDSYNKENNYFKHTVFANSSAIKQFDSDEYILDRRYFKIIYIPFIDKNDGTTSIGSKTLVSYLFGIPDNFNDYKVDIREDNRTYRLINVGGNINNYAQRFYDSNKEYLSLRNAHRISNMDSVRATNLLNNIYTILYAKKLKQFEDKIGLTKYNTALLNKAFEKVTGINYAIDKFFGTNKRIKSIFNDLLKSKLLDETDRADLSNLTQDLRDEFKSILESINDIFKLNINIEEAINKDGYKIEYDKDNRKSKQQRTILSIAKTINQLEINNDNLDNIKLITDKYFKYYNLLDKFVADNRVNNRDINSKLDTALDKLKNINNISSQLSDLYVTLKSNVSNINDLISFVFGFKDLDNTRFNSDNTKDISVKNILSNINISELRNRLLEEYERNQTGLSYESSLSYYPFYKAFNDFILNSLKTNLSLYVNGGLKHLMPMYYALLFYKDIKWTNEEFRKHVEHVDRMNISLEEKVEKLLELMSDENSPFRYGILIDSNNYYSTEYSLDEKGNVVVDNKKADEIRMGDNVNLYGEAIRIPQGNRSSTLPAEVLGVLPSYLNNCVVFSPYIVKLQGADFDYDKGNYQLATKVEIKDDNEYIKIKLQEWQDRLINLDGYLDTNVLNDIIDDIPYEYIEGFMQTLVHIFNNNDFAHRMQNEGTTYMDLDKYEPGKDKDEILNLDIVKHGNTRLSYGYNYKLYEEASVAKAGIGTFALMIRFLMYENNIKKLLENDFNLDFENNFIERYIDILNTESIYGVMDAMLQLNLDSAKIMFNSKVGLTVDGSRAVIPYMFNIINEDPNRDIYRDKEELKKLLLYSIKLMSGKTLSSYFNVKEKLGFSTYSSGILLSSLQNYTKSISELIRLLDNINYIDKDKINIDSAIDTIFPINYNGKITDEEILKQIKEDSKKINISQDQAYTIALNSLMIRLLFKELTRQQINGNSFYYRVINEKGEYKPVAIDYATSKIISVDRDDIKKITQKNKKDLDDNTIFLNIINTLIGEQSDIPFSKEDLTKILLYDLFGNLFIKDINTFNLEQFLLNRTRNNSISIDNINKYLNSVPTLGYLRDLNKYINSSNIRYMISDYDVLFKYASDNLDLIFEQFEYNQKSKYSKIVNNALNRFVIDINTATNFSKISRIIDSISNKLVNNSNFKIIPKDKLDEIKNSINKSNYSYAFLELRNIFNKALIAIIDRFPNGKLSVSINNTSVDIDLSLRGKDDFNKVLDNFLKEVLSNINIISYLKRMKLIELTAYTDYTSAQIVNDSIKFAETYGYSMEFDKDKINLLNKEILSFIYSNLNIEIRDNSDNIILSTNQENEYNQLNNEYEILKVLSEMKELFDMLALNTLMLKGNQSIRTSITNNIINRIFPMRPVYHYQHSNEFFYYILYEYNKQIFADNIFRLLLDNSVNDAKNEIIQIIQNKLMSQYNKNSRRFISELKFDIINQIKNSIVVDESTKRISIIQSHRSILDKQIRTTLNENNIDIVAYRTVARPNVLSTQDLALVLLKGMNAISNKELELYRNEGVKEAQKAERERISYVATNVNGLIFSTISNILASKNIDVKVNRELVEYLGTNVLKNIDNLERYLGFTIRFASQGEPSNYFNPDKNEIILNNNYKDVLTRISEGVDLTIDTDLNNMYEEMLVVLYEEMLHALTYNIIVNSNNLLGVKNSFKDQFEAVKKVASENLMNLVLEKYKDKVDDVNDFASSLYSLFNNDSLRNNEDNMRYMNFIENELERLLNENGLTIYEDKEGYTYDEFSNDILRLFYSFYNKDEYVTNMIIYYDDMKQFVNLTNISEDLMSSNLLSPLSEIVSIQYNNNILTRNVNDIIFNSLKSLFNFQHQVIKESRLIVSNLLKPC